MPLPSRVPYGSVPPPPIPFQVPLFVYKKSVQFGAGDAALAPFTAADAPLGNTHGDAEISMVDLANTAPPHGQSRCCLGGASAGHATGPSSSHRIHI